MDTVYEEIGERSRRQILTALMEGPKSVGDIVELTGLKQPNASNHLSRLRSRGLVRANKVGRQVYYCLACPKVESVVRSACGQSSSRNRCCDAEALVKEYARGAIKGDEGECGEILDRLLRSGATMLAIYEDLLASAQRLVGCWYETGEIDEAQEHMASCLTERMMARVAQASGAPSSTDRAAVLGCAEGNLHQIGVRMVADYLRQAGWRTLFLGASVPTAAFLETVRRHRPAAVFIGCSSEAAVAATLGLVSSLRSDSNEFLVFVGGGFSPCDAAAFLAAGADFVSCSLRQFAEEQMPLVEMALSAGR